jgi:hypothetical protein
MHEASVTVNARRNVGIRMWHPPGEMGICRFEEAHSRGHQPEAQEPQAGNGCISVHPDLVEGATGETVHLVRQAVREGRLPDVLVNNRSEGNAPVTVQALAEMLRDLVICSIAQ